MFNHNVLFTLNHMLNVFAIYLMHFLSFLIRSCLLLKCFIKKYNFFVFTLDDNYLFNRQYKVSHSYSLRVVHHTDILRCSFLYHFKGKNIIMQHLYTLITYLHSLYQDFPITPLEFR